MVVKIVGKGCNKYFEMLKVAKDISRKSKKKIEIVEVNHDSEIVKLGITNFPALIVDGKICSQGVDIDESKMEKMLVG